MTMTGKVYLASHGETWDSISLAIYKSEQYAADMLNANPDLCDVMVFEGGERVQIPVVYVDDDTERGETEPMTAPWKENT